MTESDRAVTDRPLLEVTDLAVSFKVARARGSWTRPVVRAVDGISLRIEAGETLGLVGESGSGKSTTGRAVLQLVPADSGSIQLEGTDLATAGANGRELLRKRVSMVFQDPFGSLNARMKVGDIVGEPLEIQRIGDRPSRRSRVTEILDLVGLPADAISRYPHEFSGGQRQRIGIARALAVEPALVVCDEPVAALDVSVQAQILRLLKDLQRETGVAYLFIAHDLNVVRHVSRRTAVMYLGKIVEEGPSSTLFGAPRHPYTQALTSAIPIPDPDAPRRRLVLTGEIPSPTNPPSGCRFRTRCPYAQERCAAEVPLLEPAGDGVSVACHFWKEIAASKETTEPAAR
ncbi:MAG: ATP-binding cassette domain-containing protein [Geodermatophilaceae bacterium]|nr:ATP-binding cassette domain-containing protein [Geodermatophilaceae bacterium]